MATFKIAALQKALDDSVPLNDLEMANKQYNELTAKYRDMLQKDNLLIQRTNNVKCLEVILFIVYYFEQTLYCSLHPFISFSSIQLDASLSTRIRGIFMEWPHETAVKVKVYFSQTNIEKSVL